MTQPPVTICPPAYATGYVNEKLLDGVMEVFGLQNIDQEASGKKSQRVVIPLWRRRA